MTHPHTYRIFLCHLRRGAQQHLLNRPLALNLMLFVEWVFHQYLIHKLRDSKMEMEMEKGSFKKASKTMTCKLEI